MCSSDVSEISEWAANCTGNVITWTGNGLGVLFDHMCLSLLQVFNLVVFELQKKLNPTTLNVDFVIKIELCCSKQDSCDWLRQSKGGAFVRVSSCLQKSKSTAANRKSSSSFLHLGHFLFPLLHMFWYFVFSFFSLSFFRHLLLLLKQQNKVFVKIKCSFDWSSLGEIHR